MEHRGYIILNHHLTNIEKEKIRKSNYLQLYNDFTLKIIGGSHFLTLREVITLLYPNHKNIKVQDTEELLTNQGAILVLNDYDSYLDDHKFKHVDFKLPNSLNDVARDQLEFFKEVTQKWTNYSEIIYIGLWPDELRKEISLSTREFNNLELTILYIHLIEQRLNNTAERGKRYLYNKIKY